MNNNKKSSVIDVPLPAGDQDLLGVNTYTKALIKFIGESNTPMTIAIQGEWGSGKTSMMNQLQEELCNNDQSAFYGIWINTWQYALLSDEEIILSRIVNAITEKTMKAINDRHPDKYNDSFNKVKDIGKTIFKGMLKIGASQVAGSVGSSVVDEVVGGGELSLTVNDLRENLKEVIVKSIEEDNGRKGFVFFIDDLDRIEPTFAVQILELLKNIFDIPNCIFVLAIDYGVIVKGLEPKFGKLTDENEREFRSFFDKIIQLPFTMPVSSYGIDDFIVRILDEVDYLTEEEERNDNYKRSISAMAQNSVGRNPRALKRLTNSLSLIKIFNQVDDSREVRNDEIYEKLMNIGLICCQIAYPFIYRLLAMEPDYRNWSETTASRLKLPPLKEEEVEVLDLSEEFDEEWEKILFRACQRDPYLSNNAFRISSLLNLIADQLPRDKEGELDKVIDALLSLSSVTNVEASDDARGGGGKSRGKFDGFDEFAKELDPSGKRKNLIELIKLIHDDLAKTLPDAGVSFSKEFIAFYDNSIPRTAKTFLTLSIRKLPVRIRVEKEKLDEKIPEGASEHWYKKNRSKYFDFNIESQDQYTDDVKQYIKRNYDRAKADKSPGEN